MIVLRQKQYSSLEENLETYFNFLDFETENNVTDSPVIKEVEIGNGYKQIALLYSPRDRGLECTVIFLKDKLYKFSCLVEEWPGWEEALKGIVSYSRSLRKDILDDLNYRRRQSGDEALLEKEMEALWI